MYICIYVLHTYAGKFAYRSTNRVCISMQIDPFVFTTFGTFALYIFIVRYLLPTFNSQRNAVIVII